MDRLRDPKTQVDMRSNAARIAPAFSDRGVVEWLQESMELGRAADNRFEDAFEGYEVVGGPPGPNRRPRRLLSAAELPDEARSVRKRAAPTRALRYGLHMSLLSSVKHILKMCGHALNITVHEQLSAAEVERQANATNVEFKIGKLMETDAGLLQASIHIIENLHALAGQTIVRADVNSSGGSTLPEIALLEYLYSYMPCRAAVLVDGGKNDIADALARLATTSIAPIATQSGTGKSPKSSV